MSYVNYHYSVKDNQICKKCGYETGMTDMFCPFCSSFLWTENLELKPEDRKEK